MNRIVNWSRRELLLSGLSAATLAGQQESDAVFKTDVKVVNVLATVTNKRGEIIRDLTQDDFAVLENGRPQSIRYFAKQSDLPLTIGLMVDTSMSQQRVLTAERGASFRFLDQVLRERVDKVFIVQFDMAVHIPMGPTSSRKELEETLNFVDTPTRQQLRQQTSGGTLFYDAVVTASKEYMKKLTGRKALIVLSDGVDYGSETGLMDAIEAAQRADTLVYSILFTDASFGGGDGRGPLMRIAKDTGGGYFQVSRKQSIEQIFAMIQEELRSQYSLGYISDTPVRVSEFRKLQLVTRQKGLVVQSRERYWAQR